MNKMRKLMESTVEEYSTYLPLGTQEEHDAWMDSEGFAPVRVIPHEAYIEYVWDNPLAYSYSIDAGANNMPLSENKLYPGCYNDTGYHRLNKDGYCSDCDKQIEEPINEISLKTKVDAYTLAQDPEFDYYADGTHNPERKMGQADRIRAAIARKHGEEEAKKADNAADYAHYGDYMFKEPLEELSDKRLRKYVKKAPKSAKTLKYYSDSRNDPDYEKAVKRERMVDVAKRKLGEDFPVEPFYGTVANRKAARAPTHRTVVELSNERGTLPAGSLLRAVKGSRILYIHVNERGNPITTAGEGIYRIDSKYIEPIVNPVTEAKDITNTSPYKVVQDSDKLYRVEGPGIVNKNVRYHDLAHAEQFCKRLNADVRRKYKTPEEFKKNFKSLDDLREGFPYDVDHMPGATRKDLAPKGCTACNGHRYVYKRTDGSIVANNPGNAKRIHCPKCSGTGNLTEATQQQDVIHNLAARLAAKYRATEYDEFEQEMLNFLPHELKGIANIPELFDLYNPHRQREGGEIWNRMLKNPEKYIK